jgi:hypothetical protein
MSGLNVTWTRGDGQTFTVDGGAIGLLSVTGLNAPNLEVYTQKNALGDGDLVTGRRVGSRTLEFSCKARHASLNGVLLRALPSFFTAAQTYGIEIDRSGDKRYALSCLLDSLEIPAECVGVPLSVQLSFLMPEGYFISSDSFGKNIAAIESRCGYPFAALGKYGRVYGLYAFAQTVYLDNDGDAEAYCMAVIRARGQVTYPKLIAGSGYVRVLTLMQEDDILAIDGKTKSVLLNGVNLASKLDKASDFQSLVFGLGTNHIGFSADVGANLMDVYVYYNKRFLGA